MKNKSLIIILLLIVPIFAKAQKDIKTEKISTFMFEATYAYQFPGKDTKTLYTNNNTIGASLVYKTKSNWIFELNANFISGNHVNIDRKELFGDVLDAHNEIITGDGIYGSYVLYQRGAHFQGKVGKVFPVLAPNPNCGFFVEGGLGYLFNRIRTEFGSYASPPPAMAGDYPLGYDRMRGGFAWSGEFGYLFMSNTRALNFSLSVEFIQAYTKPKRQWDFNLMCKDTNTYIDQYIGIRAAIYIPTYKRKPADYYYY